MTEDNNPDRVTLSIIMVSYNASTELARTLRALTGPATPRVSHEILLTDNASTDDAATVAERVLCHGAVVRNTRNTGFGHAVNQTVARSGGEFLLLLNPDARPRPGAIDSLVEHLRANPGHGIVGGRSVDAAGRVDQRSCFGRITAWSMTCWATGLSAVGRRSRLLSPESMGGWPRDHMRHVDVISGGFLLTTRQIWDRLQGFDETFLIYGEDQDLCLRAARLGLRPSITPAAEFEHPFGASSANRTDRDVLVLTGRATLIRLHLGAWRGYGRFALRCGVAVRSVAERVLGRPGRWHRVWQRRAEWSDGWRAGTPMPGFLATEANA
jgi:N-acetylglucosaminyl-diphospho-decaprenol L-rhamnosyltransferase